MNVSEVLFDMIKDIVKQDGGEEVAVVGREEEARMSGRSRRSSEVHDEGQRRTRRHLTNPEQRPAARRIPYGGYPIDSSYLRGAPLPPGV